MKKVSVIIPNYNHSPYLIQRIDSVLNQTYNNIEVIILDDCSTDSSQDVIYSYSNNYKIKKILFNKKNSGSTFKQWTKGLKIATGDYIWIAESDDIAKENFLEETVSILNNYQDVGFVHTLSYLYSEENEINNVYYPNFHTSFDWSNDFYSEGLSFIKKAMFVKNPLINASAILFRRTCLTPDVINPSYKQNGDWFIYINILRHSNFYHIGKPLNFFRQHTTNKASIANSKNFSNVKEYSDLISFIFCTLNLTKSEKNVLRFSFIKKWFYQNNKSLKNLLKNDFFSISKKALRNDSFVFLKILKMRYWN